MIGNTLAYIAKRVDTFLAAGNQIELPSSGTHLSAFPSTSQSGSLSLQQNKISLLLINIEDQREQRAVDVYRIRNETGKADKRLRKMPSARLTLNVLFVASHTDYVHAWNQLSHLIYGFQLHPVFSIEEDPDFPINTGPIASEMITQSLHDQRDTWAALRICQQPSLLYRFKFVTLEPQADEPIPVVTTVGVTYQHA